MKPEKVYPYRDCTKAAAIGVIKEIKCPWKYSTPERQWYYQWALTEAMRVIRTSADPPLVTLEALQIKYDKWAHTHNGSAYLYSICATAVEDAIQQLLTAY